MKNVDESCYTWIRECLLIINPQTNYKRMTN